MLICPQCNAENPNRNNFCQKCGISLTHQPCPQCGAEVLLSEPLCSQCGAVTGKILTLLVRNQNLQEAFLPDHLEIYEGCIDIGQRYQLFVPAAAPSLLPHPWCPAPANLLLGQVVDCQPLQPSILKVLFAQQTDFLNRIPSLAPEEVFADASWQSLGLPPLALPYLQQKDLIPKVPEIYDAWCEGDYEFVLLNHFHNTTPLDTALKDESVSALQLTFWLNQLLMLWPILAPQGYGQSLMIMANVQLDEDQHIVLNQICPDPLGGVTLAQFVQFVQEQFSQSAQTLPTAILDLLEPLITAAETDISTIFPKIAKIVQGLEPPSLFVDDSDFAEFSVEELEEESLPAESISTSPDAVLPVDKEVDDIPTAVLPMQLVSLSDAGYTDRGRNRPHNEDYFGISTSVEVQRNNHGKQVKAKGLYIICDGMGGHAAGEVASKTAVTTLQHFCWQHWQDSLPRAEVLVEGIAETNEKIYTINQGNSSSGSGRMGTTLVVVLVHDTQVMIAHVGDSRIYRVTRKGGLEQLTVDHEVGQQAIQNGLDPKIAYSRPDAYQLTQAIGPHESKFIRPDVRVLDIEEDSLIFLCSDGISDNDLIEENWETYLLPLLSSSQDIERGLRKLMEFANEYNGHDNLTGVLVRLKVRPQIPMDIW